MSANLAGLTVPEVRSRLESLASLPLRPQTARSLIDSVSGLDPHLELDPGWCLAELRDQPLDEPWSRLADSSWWLGDCEPSIRPLWLYSVAVATVSRRLATQRGLSNPEHLARVALLHRLGEWALAAVAPTLLGSILQEPDLERRRQMEVRWLGQSLERLGERLAGRWNLHPDLQDAVWLFRDTRGTLNACAQTPEHMAVLQEAVRLVESTSLALDRPIRDEPRLNDPPRKRLMAEVQSRTSERFAASDATAFEERLVREHARLQLRHRQLEGEHQGLLEMLEGLSGVAEAPADPQTTPARLPEVVKLRWTERDRRLERLEHHFRTVVDAHQRWLKDVESSQQAERLSALAQFAAGAGHELNNPLAVIMGRAQLLLARTRDADAVRCLQAIIAQSQRAHRILRDLMYVARPPSPRPRLCQPGEVVRSSLRDLASEAEARGVRLVIEPSDPIGWSMTDPDPLRHLADVLVRNAIESTPSGGLIRVRSFSSDRSMTWEVLDSGRGLSDEEVARMLDPFYCGRQAGRGLGLGLSRLARFLQLSGGSLTWRSVPNRGSLFSATLPRVTPPSADGGASAA
ncbi:MAG TPA: HDOD domain-containing protein [Isosphaeraceae bacterium]|nr:HDOD domain-containing protein [Isosphaeraceae bacterium]